MKRPAKPTPKQKTRGRGRPEGSDTFKPSIEQRTMVVVLAGFGVPQDEIAKAIPSPYANGEAISPVTLRKHFRHELDTGIAQVKMQIAGNLLSHTKTNASAAIFASKVRLGLKETVKLEHSGKVSGAPALTEEQMERRILQLINEGAKEQRGGSRRPRRKS